MSVSSTSRTARSLLAAALVALALPASAQLLASLSAEPAQARVGEPVRFTLNLDVTGGANCGVHMHWGDGQTETFKINQAKDIPLVTTHTFAKPGTYQVVAEGKRVESTLKCGGRNQAFTVVVAPATPVAAAPAPAGAAKPTVCPDGWALAKPGVNKKTGAYTCSAKAGTPLPTARATCPGDLSYFENAKKGQLGCKA